MPVGTAFQKQLQSITARGTYYELTVWTRQRAAGTSNRAASNVNVGFWLIEY